ncbi:guanylate kinase [Streptomyces sp. ISL-98]|uniref:guanylate kinase n=1 Tax=Streptomyces sp. ISL-98 TaxID=2819192 RepID=UPI001BE677E8|nr:guanylate kinase [Streptomyces sp. ISL-98]MBT2510017.1 guanylate kinase [Streptomyces sp. ISL-98]
MTTCEHIEELSQAGELLYRNARYDAEYAIDQRGVSDLVEGGRIPVLHMGQVAGASAIGAFPIRWAKVLLWCPQAVTEERCKGRGDKDVDVRLKVWHETRQDLLDHAGEPWPLVIETHRLTPAQAARNINGALTVGTLPEVRNIRKLVG